MLGIFGLDFGLWDFELVLGLMLINDNFRAPTDCVQYFTGTSDNIQSYNFNGAQLLQGMNYKNCIRTEEGYCAIQWRQGHFSTSAQLIQR